MRTALVTGVAGQDGTYLARSLLADGFRVVGTIREPAGAAVATYLDGVDLRVVDVRDADRLRALVADVAPDEVYNLAAISSVARSWREPELVRAVNLDAVEVLVGALLDLRDRTGRDVRLLQASSSEVGGEAAGSPYARAKAAAEEVVVDARARGLRACCARLHVHESPLRPEGFVSRRITKGAAAIAAGLADHLELGNLDVVRDWGFAGEYVEALRLMNAQEVPTDLPLGTGRAHSLIDFVRCAFAAVGLDGDDVVRQDPALMRPADTAVLVCDPEPAAAALGWRAETHLATLIGHMVAVDVERLRSGVPESVAYLHPRSREQTPH